jgi:hypothetical protein
MKGSTFSGSWKSVFARDAGGRVTHMMGRITGGPAMVARRIR